ncbi:PLP-dependent aminotransferase family protein [uncultured Propionivibrio sp.]|uniref:MocR-like pyridoxine biosynthesis transcription factor PdxR n=1 Tax=uncultured Propionivibrio sp. TaxID=426737 RepID=UPI003748E162
MEKGSKTGLSRRLYEEFRSRIADGTYVAGAVVPSTRALAVERGLSRATVSLVYEQLAADGFIETFPGAASRVVTGAAPATLVTKLSNPINEQAAASFMLGLSAIGERISTMALADWSPARTGEIDFVYGPLAGSDFPSLNWMKAVRAVERQRGRRLEYEDPLGNPDLRRELQAHLSLTRGLVCSIDQLMIVNGSQQALDLCARLLTDPGDVVVVENPGYRMAHHVFEAYGAALQCVDVDNHGLVTDQLDGLGTVRLAYVTPTHQFPLGSFLPIARRRQLLDWAALRKVWIIEDDYDSEYRYAVRPEETLQSLDARGCVIHIGTFSKTLSPQLRLGYLVLPKPLIKIFAAAKRLTDRHTATGVQRALALLLETGGYNRHVRRIRRLQQARQNALVKALDMHLGGQVEVQGAASGLHLVVWFRSLPANVEQLLVEAALQRGVRVYPISSLFNPCRPSWEKRQLAGLVMGYALLEPETIEIGVRHVAEALFAVREMICQAR